MCACEATFVCTRCQGTVFDWRWWLDVSPREFEEEQRYAQRLEAAVAEPGLTRETR